MKPLEEIIKQKVSFEGSKEVNWTNKLRKPENIITMSLLTIVVTLSLWLVSSHFRKNDGIAGWYNKVVKDRVYNSDVERYVRKIDGFDEIDLNEPFRVLDVDAKKVGSLTTLYALGNFRNDNSEQVLLEFGDLNDEDLEVLKGRLIPGNMFVINEDHASMVILQENHKGGWSDRLAVKPPYDKSILEYIETDEKIPNSVYEVWEREYAAIMKLANAGKYEEALAKSAILDESFKASGFMKGGPRPSGDLSKRFRTLRRILEEQVEEYGQEEELAGLRDENTSLKGQAQVLEERVKEAERTIEEKKMVEVAPVKPQELLVELSSLVNKIAYIKDGEVYVMNADGTNQERLTNDRWWDLSPKISPDGSMVLYVRHGLHEPHYGPPGSGTGWRCGQIDLNDLMLVDINGDNLKTLLHLDRYHCKNPAWSFDGKSICFELEKREEKGSEPEELAERFELSLRDNDGNIVSIDEPEDDDERSTAEIIALARKIGHGPGALLESMATSRWRAAASSTELKSRFGIRKIDNNNFYFETTNLDDRYFLRTCIHDDGSGRWRVRGGGTNVCVFNRDSLELRLTPTDSWGRYSDASFQPVLMYKN